MPSAKDRAVDISATHQRHVPVSDPIRVAPFQPIPTPLAPNLTQNSMMLTSLPSVTTRLDGGVRQFFGGRNLPTRRVSLP